jgi:aspartate/methionine/tyrosine aminotransferase
MPIFPASRLADIAPFHVMELMARARALAADGRDIIHMEVGEPDFPTPEPIVAAARASIENGRVFYTPALGLPELRRAIADFYQTRYGLSIPAARIAVTAGASGALLLALACLVEPGSEWLLTDPGYPCNRHFVRSFEGLPVGIPVGPESNFQPSPADLEAHWNVRSAGALLASPANPTGTMLSNEQLDAIADFIRQRQGQLIVDEIYHGLTYDRVALNCAPVRRRYLHRPEFFQVFQHDRLAAGLAGRPRTLHPRHRETRPESFHFTVDTGTARGTRRLHADHDQPSSKRGAQEFRRRRDFLAPALEGLGFRLDGQDLMAPSTSTPIAAP